MDNKIFGELCMIEDAIDYLNSLLEADREAVSNLVENRVQCNNDLANHPTCEVKQGCYGINGSEYYVGMLGVINGLLRDPSNPQPGPICAVFDSRNKLVRFEKYKMENKI